MNQRYAMIENKKIIGMFGSVFKRINFWVVSRLVQYKI